MGKAGTTGRRERDAVQPADDAQAVEGCVGANVRTYGWGTVELLAYRARSVAGEPNALADHEEVRWAPFAELAGYDFANADLAIVRLLTGEGDEYGEMASALARQACAIELRS